MVILLILRNRVKTYSKNILKNILIFNFRFKITDIAMA